MSGPARFPTAVAEALRRISSRGHQAHGVGRCVAELWAGRQPREFEIATSASPRELMRLFPSAVPVAPRHLLLPTAAGPVDLLPHSFGDGILAELAHRDFTRHAIALDADGIWIDPHAGLADLREARLRCVGDPRARLAEDPLRALRAARYVSTHELQPDPELAEALPSQADALAKSPAMSLRGELHALLLGPAVARGLALLRDGGLAEKLAPGVADDAPAVVAALPAQLELRLAGWLRGARAVRTLRRLREPRERVVTIERLLQLHPLDAGASPLKRLLRRPEPLVAMLFALREAEIRARGEGESAQRRLDRLRAAANAERRALAPGPEIALDGRAVMDILGCGPGPEVGRALAQLRKAVEADPACNHPAALRQRLLAWRNEPARTPEEP